MSERSVNAAGLFVAMALLVLLPARVDAAQHGSRPGIVVEHGQQSARVLSFGEPVSVAGEVHGDVQVAGANASIEGKVEGDVVVMFGDISLGERADVTGDVICVGGTIAGAERAKIGGEVLSPGSISGTFRMNDPGSAVRQKPFSLVAAALKLSLLFAWLVAAVVLALAFGKEVRAGSQELRASPLHTLLLGGVAFTSFILTAIVFSYLVSFMVGIPLLALLAAFALVTKIFGMVAVFHAVGTKVAGARDREQQDRRRWLRGDLAMIVVGLVIMGFIRMIPVVGNLVWAMASLFGIGVALATKFGRREPWFLAWQTVTQRVQ